MHAVSKLVYRRYKKNKNNILPVLIYDLVYTLSRYILYASANLASMRNPVWVKDRKCNKKKRTRKKSSQTNERKQQNKSDVY